MMTTTVQLYSYSVLYLDILSYISYMSLRKGLCLRGILIPHIPSKPNRPPPPIVLRQDSQRLVNLPHTPWSPINKSLPTAINILLSRLSHTLRLAQHLRSFPDPHEFQEIALAYGSMDFDVFAC